MKICKRETTEVIQNAPEPSVETKDTRSLTPGAQIGSLVDRIADAYGHLTEEQQVAILELAGAHPTQALLKLTTGQDVDQFVNADSVELLTAAINKLATAMELPPIVTTFAQGKLVQSREQVEAVVQGFKNALINSL